jgi:two-component system sensor histidine kinase CiaH
VIKKLRRKLVLIVMAVVALILLVIFLALLITTQKNNERMSVDILRQSLNMQPFHSGISPPESDGNPSGSPSLSRRPSPQMRMPVLMIEIDYGGNVAILSNQLHFIVESDLPPIAEIVSGRAENMGILSNYALRYLREDAETGVRVAFADISVEQEILRTQIIHSVLICALAMLAFFLLSLFLARWAVRPVEIAWEQQKQFIADASHELKTPLTVILSNADMLRSEENLGVNKNIKRMEHIHAEAVRMKHLVEDMLLLAKSDSGEGAKMHSAVDFSYIVKSTVLTYEPIIYDEEKKLSYEIEDCLFVQGDMTRLQQVIHILLDNARKYSSVHGAIDVRLVKAENKSLLLSISNEGAPIPKGRSERSAGAFPHSLLLYSTPNLTLWRFAALRVS